MEKNTHKKTKDKTIFPNSLETFITCNGQTGFLVIPVALILHQNGPMSEFPLFYTLLSEPCFSL